MFQKSEYEMTAGIFKRIKDEYGLNLYEKVLELRKFEIENFWKRAIFFWGTIALIYVAFFRLPITSSYIIIVPLIGLLFNIIFSLSIRGSKYWQEHYEELATFYEHSMDFVLFNHENSTKLLGTKPFVLSKPHRFSVSKLAMLLADLSVIVWVLLWIKALNDISNSLKFEFSLDSSFHFPTAFVVIAHICLVGYFVIFLLKGNVYHRPSIRKGQSSYARAEYIAKAKKQKEDAKDKMYGL